MEQGKTVQEMTMKELKELAKALKIKGATTMKQKELILAIEKYENDNFGPIDSKEGTVNAPVESTESEVVAEEKWAMGYHEGKKILSITDKEVNGIMYKEITVEDKTTYLERA